MSLSGNANANAFLGKLYTEGGSEIKKDYVLALKYYKVRVLRFYIIFCSVMCCYLYKLSVKHMY